MALALLIVAIFFIWSDRVDTGIATSVGNQAIAPTCDAPGVVAGVTSSGNGDGTSDQTVTAETAGVYSAPDTGLCQP